MKHTLLMLSLLASVVSVPSYAKEKPKQKDKHTEKTAKKTEGGEIEAALRDASRPKSDVERDGSRHPAELLALSGVKAGDRVADVIPGTGYFTRPFSKIAGAKGHVYAIVPADVAELPEGFGNALKKNFDAATALSKEAGYSNITVFKEPLDRTLAPESLDMVWTSQNYHDIYGFYGIEAAARFSKAVFESLKPGGVFLVVDHAAVAKSGAKDATTLHRIDPETVKAQVLAAGFILETDSAVLQNKDDNHTLKVFDPAIRGKTDQFVFKFRKPKA